VCHTSVLLHLTEADALAVLIRVGDISVRLKVPAPFSPPNSLYRLAFFTILESMIDSGVILFASGYVLASSCKIVSIPFTGG